MRKKVFIQIQRWFLPLLFITFINGKIFFTHTHLIGDSIVVHSHPFKKSESKTHSHTTKEFIAIEHLYNGFSTDSIIPHLEINSPLLAIVLQELILTDKIFLSQENHSFLLRAPPFIS